MSRADAAPWTSDRDLDRETVADLIGEQFPELAGQPVAFLKAGWDSEAFEVGGEWIFRFPKREIVVDHLETELAVLPLIAGRLPLAVPRPLFAGEPTPRFPYRFMGYRKIPGVPADSVDRAALDVDGILDAVIEFLAPLHAIPVEGAITRARGWEPGEDLRTRVEHLELAGEPIIAASIARMESLASAAPAARLIHDDLGAEHVLIDPATSAVTGIIDWGDMNVGDPANDFIGLIAWAALESVRQALARSGYLADPELLRRAVGRLIWCVIDGWCDGVEFDEPVMRARASASLARLIDESGTMVR